MQTAAVTAAGSLKLTSASREQCCWDIAAWNSYNTRYLGSSALSVLGPNHTHYKRLLSVIQAVDKSVIIINTTTLQQHQPYQVRDSSWTGGNRTFQLQACLYHCEFLSCLCIMMLHIISSKYVYFFMYTFHRI